ncbi:MAG: RNA-binding transcriptional accessory protein [Blastocatellia bacterium]|nr:RNA-binding transcriptional accessory protein [Blastocatellia bacterium]
MNHAQQIAARLNLRPTQVAAVIELLDAGNTLPFIARYRKEATGALDEDQLRQISGLIASLRALDERRQTILASIEEQGKLTPELRQQLLAADTRALLEDLYLPYKPKRRTRATIAREKGLEGLADLILKQLVTRQSVNQIAAPYLSDEVTTVEDALAGARDIVAETVSDHAGVRKRLREKAQRWAVVRCEKIGSAEDARGVYRIYYEFDCRVDRLRPHQVLALNRGESEKVLRVRMDLEERDWQQAISSAFRSDRRSPLADELEMAIDDGAKRLLLPAIEREVRRELTELAEAHAIKVFADNLRGLLGQPPLSGRTVLGIDPGLRTGCKVAVVDPTGKVLDTTNIYPHEPQKQWDAALKTLASLIARHRATLIAIGNGTASRETERLAAELIRKSNQAGATLHYLTVNEAGASVYSASPLARAELPGLDVTLRGAVSIARRVQDPLAELVKIDPKSIGVGLYQHDVNQPQLASALAGVVESAVNNVGVEVNTASASLLTYVAGIGPKLAERIVIYRDENGPFVNRKSLLKVPGLGPKAFEQAAGFLRIRDGENPLDASAIHPESYSIATAVLKRAGVKADAPATLRESSLAGLRAARPLSELADELGAGVPTLTDIFEQLVRPGRDPRSSLPAPILRSDVLSMEDLQPGMRLSGTVRNVVDFGAFVDIGVKQDGLLHRSQMPRGATLGVGDIIEVAILQVEPERGRISLGWVE